MAYRRNLRIERSHFDQLEQNLNPIGRMFYAASTLLCTPASLSQDLVLGLGPQAGEPRIREVVTNAGFTRLRRAAQTPFNLIFRSKTVTGLLFSLISIQRRTL